MCCSFIQLFFFLNLLFVDNMVFYGERYVIQFIRYALLFFRAVGGSILRIFCFFLFFLKLINFRCYSACFIFKWLIKVLFERLWYAVNICMRWWLTIPLFVPNIRNQIRKLACVATRPQIWFSLWFFIALSYFSSFSFFLLPEKNSKETRNRLFFR